MRARSIWIITGGIIILLGWIYALFFTSGTCPGTTNVGGFPFTGCALIDSARVISSVSTILGAVIIIYGFWDGRPKPVPEETQAERKPTNPLVVDIFLR